MQTTFTAARQESHLQAMRGRGEVKSKRALAHAQRVSEREGKKECERDREVDGTPIKSENVAKIVDDIN